MRKLFTLLITSCLALILVACGDSAVKVIPDRELPSPIILEESVKATPEVSVEVTPDEPYVFTEKLLEDPPYWIGETARYFGHAYDLDKEGEEVTTTYAFDVTWPSQVPISNKYTAETQTDSITVVISGVDCEKDHDKSPNRKTVKVSDLKDVFSASQVELNYQIEGTYDYKTQKPDGRFSVLTEDYVNVNGFDSYRYTGTYTAIYGIAEMRDRGDGSYEVVGRTETSTDIPFVAYCVDTKQCDSSYVTIMVLNDYDIRVNRDAENVIEAIDGTMETYAHKMVESIKVSEVSE